MGKENKQSNILLAFLMSTLTALAGSVVFGLIYAIGYYIYILAIAEVFLALGIFLKFYNKNKKIVIIASIWCISCTFLFNVVAILVSESYFIAKDFSCSLLEAFKLLIELWKIDSSVQSYMNKRMLEVLVMLVLGGVVIGLILLSRKTRQKIASRYEKEVVIENEANQYNQPDSISIYNSLIEKLKIEITELTQTKNQEMFKNNIKEFKNSKIATIDEKTKKEIIHLANQQINNSSVLNLDKKANELLLKLLK